MKKNLILSAMAFAALAFVGCSKDDVVSESPTLNNAIEFSTYLGRSAKTRGTETTTDAIKAQDAGFGVLAYYTGPSEFKSESATPNFMYNQQVTHNTTADKWTYDPVKYWPTTKNDMISFFAYAPYEKQEQSANNLIKLSANNAKGIPTVTFTIADSANNMVDFVADAAYNKTWQKDASTGDDADTDTDGVNESEVNFNLLHELTRVSFQAKVDEAVALGESETSATRVAITSIKLNSGNNTNFYKSAKYTFPSDNATRGSWSYDNPDATMATTEYDIASVLDLKNFTDSGLTLASGKLFNEEDYSAIWLNPAENTAIPIFKGGSTTDDKSDDEYLFLIPPQGENGVITNTSNAPMSITVTYDIITADGNLSKGYSITSATKTVSLGGTVDVPLLKQGTSYVYTLIFGIDEIQVSADVDDNWNESTNNVNVNYGDTDATASADNDGGADA